MQLCEIAQPNRAKREKCNHEAVAHQPGACKLCEMGACFAAPDQLEPKRQQPPRQNDAVIFGPRPHLIAEIALNLPQPYKVAPWCEDRGDSPNLPDIGWWYSLKPSALKRH